MSAANDNRPAEFDARVMQYYPHLRNLSFKLTRNTLEQEDLLNETIARPLENWTKFRPDGGFYNWITFMMRSYAQEKRRTEKRRAKRAPMVNDEKALAAAATMPNQFDSAALREALDRVPESRDGTVLIRRAMGDTLVEIAADYGISNERARQIESQERKRLKRAA